MGVTGAAKVNDARMHNEWEGGINVSTVPLSRDVS